MKKKLTTQPTAAVDDQRIPELLRAYHRQGITDRKRLRKLLLDEHAIQMRSVPHTHILTGDH
jgi:hypothetical protein